MTTESLIIIAIAVIFIIVIFIIAAMIFISKNKKDKIAKKI